ncbi:MAG: YcgN family cysteine cluster protein [Siculibacillus sp.]|nr:YcgN family cysteine cluster protein [Siculibacillus sp.]
MDERSKSEDAALPFWRAKRLDEMSRDEWESLCDRCGRCCLNKLEDDETGEIFWTDVACKLLDHRSCLCASYSNRHDFVPDCVELDVEEVLTQTYTWLPPTCAYRLLAEGRPLESWHPLVSGDPESVHRAGVSVRGRVRSEEDIPADTLEHWIVEWPGEVPVPLPPRPPRRNKRTKSIG